MLPESTFHQCNSRVNWGCSSEVYCNKTETPWRKVMELGSYGVVVMIGKHSRPKAHNWHVVPFILPLLTG